MTNRVERICEVSKQKFVIMPEDIEFYKKSGVILDDDIRGLPTLCPEERMRRRLAWRNERSLYNRECSGTGKKIVSMYSADQKFPVYDNSFWWGDEWDGKDNFFDFDFSKQFFLQFENLLNVAPRMARVQQGVCENSTFTNCASNNKNCYLLFAVNSSEDCAYGAFVLNCKNSFDNLYLTKSELCYESVTSEDCYSSTFLQNSKRCSESHFLKNCISCTNCFGSVNLRNKEYYFLNKKYSKEEYFKKLEEVGLSKYSRVKNLRKYFAKLFQKYPVKFSESLQNHNSSGDYLYNSKDSFECWDASNLESCKFVSDSENIKTSYDVSSYGCLDTNELLYECAGVGLGVYNVKFSNLCWGGCKNLEYCIECFKSEDCFGCIGLKNAKYCILNKQYSKEEYFILREKIISYMKTTKEWGEFFPMSISPFGYNTTIANEFFPLKDPELCDSKNRLKYKWSPEKTQAKYEGLEYEIPDDIKDVSDEILQKILQCEVTGKYYKIVQSELKFYRKMNIPIPRKCPDQRHKERFNIRNPRKLFERTCEGCDVKISTTYAKERPEKVFCEKCYLERVD